MNCHAAVLKTISLQRGMHRPHVGPFHVWRRVVAHLEAAGEADSELGGLAERAREVAEGCRQVQAGQVGQGGRPKVIAILGSILNPKP